MDKAKTVVIQILIGFVLLEILLRCLSFQKTGNDKFAITSAFKSIGYRRTDNYRCRFKLPHPTNGRLCQLDLFAGRDLSRGT
jgi:hypothetical protein